MSYNNSAADDRGHTKRCRDCGEEAAAGGLCPQCCFDRILLDQTLRIAQLQVKRPSAQRATQRAETMSERDRLGLVQEGRGATERSGDKAFSPRNSVKTRAWPKPLCGAAYYGLVGEIGLAVEASYRSGPGRGTGVAAHDVRQCDWPRAVLLRRRRQARREPVRPGGRGHRLRAEGNLGRARPPAHP
jgi:hypothetical protein